MRGARRTVTVGFSLLCGAKLLAAYGSSSAAVSPKRAPAASERGGVVTFAETAGSSPNYISPLDQSADMTVDNIAQFQNLMYKPLYSANYLTPTMDFATSLANRPLWSDGDRVITITLKHYRWSNGSPVTARDVSFYTNLARAGGADWGYYTPGDFPYNVKKMVVDGPYELTIDLSEPYNPTYYLDNQLSEITPLPRSVWDRTSLNGRVGNYDETPSGAKRVWSFLTSYAEKMGTYSDSNKIWGVIDGPYKLASFGGDASPDIFEPNPRYSGHHSIIAKFEELPFTSNAAEYDDLRSGSGVVTIGFVPSSDVPTLETVKSEGYRIAQVPGWDAQFFLPNLKNPVLGATFSQLYIRQALQHLVDQPVMIRDFLRGYGAPTYGPAPLDPPNHFADAAERKNPYPYSISAAERLLSSHGWKMVHGVRTCESSKCGKGVKIGTALRIKLLDPSGSSSITEEGELFEADAARAGIDIELEELPYNTVLGIVNPCTPGQDGVTLSSAVCTWQLANYEGWSYDLFPNGGEILLPGADGDAGSFSNATLSKLILEVRHDSSLRPYYAYENLAARLVPFIWMPAANSIEAVATDLAGPGTVSVFGALDPNYWYLKKR